MAGRVGILEALADTVDMAGMLQQHPSLGPNGLGA
jgi:hypothetical protein